MARRENTAGREKASITTGGAIGTIDEGNQLSLPCGWDTAININEVERIVFNGLVLWEK